MSDQRSPARANGGDSISAGDWSLVEYWLDRVLDLPPPQARRVLDQECENETVRREVASLLANDSTGSDDVLERGLADVAGDLLERASAEPGTASKKRVGNYELIESLGLGGMGEVYSARRVDGQFEHEVAIKLLHAGVTSSSQRDRFMQERQILAQLQHPNVAGLLDGGVSEDGTPYLVMERIRGEPIDSYVAENQLSPREIVKLLLEICSAVEYAHRNMVVHRDLKPSNLLVQEGGRVVLLDFGIAKLIGGSPESGLTRQGRSGPLTPNYAAPEQLRGEAVLAASDVYALGVLLFELLTGQLPHQREGLTTAQMIEQSCHDATEPPSAALSNQPVQTWRAKARRRREIEGDLDSIVLQMLRTDPQERYQDVASLRRDLEAHLEGYPVSARRATRWYRTQRFARRHRAALGAAAAFALAVVFGLVGTIWQARAAAAEASRAEQAVSFLASVLADADPRHDSPGERTLTTLLHRAESRLDQELTESPAVRTRLRLVLAEAFDGVGLQDKSEELFALGLEEAGRWHGENSLEFAQALTGLALLRSQAGDQSSLQALERALRIVETETGGRSLAYVRQLGHLAEARLVLQDNVRAEADLRRALDLVRLYHPEDRLWLAALLANLGNCLENQSRLQESLPYHQEALDLYREMGLETSFTAAKIRNNLAIAQQALGLYEQAEEGYRFSLRNSEQRFAAGHPEIAVHRTNLARVMIDRGDFQGAYEQSFAAYRSLRDAVDPGDYRLQAARVNAASAAFEVGDLATAHTLYEEAHRRFSEQLGETHLAPVRVGWLWSRVFLAEGRLARAEPLVEVWPDGGETAVPIARRALPFLMRGRLATAGGDLSNARQFFERARAAQAEAVPANHYQLLEVDSEIAALDVIEGGDPARLHQLVERLGHQLPAENWRLVRMRPLLR